VQLGRAPEPGIILHNSGLKPTTESEENHSIYKYKGQLLFFVLILVFNRCGHVLEFNDLHSSPNIIRVNKWRRMRWAEQLARKGERRVAYVILVEKPE